MKEVKLCQIVAIEKDVKEKTQRLSKAFTEMCARPELFSGMVKNYEPIAEDGERFPPEHKAVRYQAQDLIEALFDAFREEVDVEATKDCGNAVASADIVVDDVVLLASAPVPFLLYLEKVFTKLSSLLSAVPVRDEVVEWETNAGLCRSKEITTHRTKKVQKPIVLYDATEEHPAQTQLISEDVVIGHWKTVHLCGAPKEQDVKDMISRIDDVLKAVKFAREEANSTKVQRKTDFAKELLSYVLTRQA